MDKPHPIELRDRVVSYVEDGYTHRAAAIHFRVSPRFVNNMVILKRETRALLPIPQGNMGKAAKMLKHIDWLNKRAAFNGDITLDELCVE